MKIDTSKIDLTMLDTGIRVLFKLIAIAGAHGEIKTNKSTLAEELGKSRECIAQHINRLASAKILKYKYSGVAILNPEVIYVGADADYALSLALYQKFKSDVT